MYFFKIIFFLVFININCYEYLKFDDNDDNCVYGQDLIIEMGVNLYGKYSKQGLFYLILFRIC